MKKLTAIVIAGIVCLSASAGSAATLNLKLVAGAPDAATGEVTIEIFGLVTDSSYGIADVMFDVVSATTTGLIDSKEGPGGSGEDVVPAFCAAGFPEGADFAGNTLFEAGVVQEIS